MKIAIIGTHSTGKTTLCKLLLAELQMRGYKAKLLPEFARKCPFPINEETTLEAQAWIQEEQIKQEALLHKEKEIMICDRASIDNLAYMQAAAKGSDILPFTNTAIAHAGSYAHLFKTSCLNLAAKEDGIRTTDGAFRSKIDEEISSLLDAHAIAYHTLAAHMDYTQHVQDMLEMLSLEK